MKKVNFIFLILFLFIVNSCNSNKDKEVKENSFDMCKNTNKIDSLIQQIVLVPDIYRSVPNEKKSYRYIVFNAMKPTRDFYEGYFDTLYTVNKRIALDDDVGTLFIDSAEFNIDSSSVKIVAKFYILAKYATTTTFLTLKYDKSICNWVISKQSTDLH